MTKRSLPPNIATCRKRAAVLLKPLRLTRELSWEEQKGLFLSSRTNAGRSLPPYYLVYFLLIDLLQFPHLGRDEKVAWSVPLQYEGRNYLIEHRKMGLGIFEPQHDPNQNMSGAPTEQGEKDAAYICKLVQRACAVAKPYFQWRAELEAQGSKLNVTNHSSWLYDKYEFFSSRAFKLKNHRVALAKNKDYSSATQANTEAHWFAQAAIEAFFSWSEHVFIHLAILQSKISTGEQVRKVATSEWKEKFKLAIDITWPDAKKYYDSLLDLRAQIRNFLAHGSFGKRGEAFSFHSGAGAVPLLITEIKEHPFEFYLNPPIKDFDALQLIADFLDWLWSTDLGIAKLYVESGFPLILTYVRDGTYSSAMKSQENMSSFLHALHHLWDNSANMDW